MKEKEKNESCICFGPGYREYIPVREIQVCPICASSEPDVALEELPTEPFRFEKIGTEDNETIRIRSAANLINKLHQSCVAGHSHIQDVSVRTAADGKKMLGIVAGCYTHPERLS